MKVLQINSVCGYGSTGKIAVDIYNMLKINGDDCVIAYGRKTAPSEINSIKIGSSIDNYCGVFATRLFDKHGFTSKKATLKLIKEIDEYNPDIIHLHNLHGYYLNIEILFKYLNSSNKPVIWTLHDCWPMTGHCSYFDYIGCEKWREACYECPQLNQYPSSIFADNSYNNFKLKKELFTSIKNMVIVTPSKWLQSIAKQSFLGKYEVICIYNGINLDEFRPLKSDFRKKYDIENKFVILSVANVWEQRKGIDYLFELSKSLDSSYAMVVVGLDNKVNTPDNVIKIPLISSKKELAEIYSSADVFVNTTLEETLGLVNIEALACGTPVITFNTGGSPECINSTCGIKVPKCDTNSLKKAVCNVRENNFNGYDCVKFASNFNKDKVYKDYYNLYKDILRQER